MKRIMPIALLGFLALSFQSSVADDPLKINGSTTVNPVVAEAAEFLRKETGMKIFVDTQGGSSGGIAALGEGRVHMGMSSKPVSEKDRKKYPKVTFHQTHLGEDAVALVVSRDVWEGGVHAISKAQVQSIYEGRVKNWKKLGGPDQRIVFFNKEPGRGTWEVFAKWLYGSAKNAPYVSLPEVGANAEARNKVSSTRGSISQLSASWADGKTVFPLAIITESGKEISPTPENISTHVYPLSRPLFLLTNGEPKGDAHTMIQFILSERGQDLVVKHGYLPLKQLQAGHHAP